MSKDMNPCYIAYKVKETYPITNTVYWTQKLDGPFTDSVKLDEALNNLREAKRRGDVKNIMLLEEG